MPPTSEIDRIVNGVRHPWATTDEILASMNTFEVRDDDIWVITYPKAGTTWMQEIVSVLYYGGDFEKADELSIRNRFVFLDLQMTSVSPVDKANSQLSPRFLKTHLPSHQMAKQLTVKKPKIVFVGRNPKDNAVSLYHFHRANAYLRTYESWDEFFQAFCTDNTLGGSWFDINLYWWNRRNDENVLFVKYEDMKRELPAVIQRISEFFGWPIPDGKLEDIVKHCSFDSMKKNPKTNYADGKNINQSISPFMRKGTVGDWKNYFTINQNAEFDSIYAEKMKYSDLSFEFEL